VLLILKHYLPLTPNLLTRFIRFK